MFKFCLIFFCLGVVHCMTEKEEDYFDSLFDEASEPSTFPPTNIPQFEEPSTFPLTDIPQYELGPIENEFNSTTIQPSLHSEYPKVSLITTPIPFVIASQTTTVVSASPIITGRTMETESKYLFL